MIRVEKKWLPIKLVPLACKKKKEYYNSNGRDINKKYHIIFGENNFLKYRELNRRQQVGAEKTILLKKKKDITNFIIYALHSWFKNIKINVMITLHNHCQIIIIPKNKF